ncbi:hypothetical protein D910_11291 [Dendroctonus ponderosae]|uniref:protein-tyrosine-phosphatase n=1 Tax=Dendroctonus ponderosae TaxID=77166 RepID=U4UUW2_DENPD|nr:hypothetical protein D910_11291 [Dendroctonus ponderosae]
MAVYPSCFRHLILLCTVVFVICSQQSISTVSDADVITTVGSVKPVSEPITDTSIIIISETAFPTEIRLSINITTTDNGTFCPFTLLVNCTTINDWSWIISKSANFEFRLEEPISTVILDHLAKFTNYTCEFQQAGQLLLFTSFTTSEDVPSTPENVTVSAITPTSFNLSWTEPIEVPTVLFGYNITIQRGDVSSSNHFWSDCFNGTQLFEIYINSSAESLSYNFQNASADFSYDVSISAWSRIGNGNSTNINISTTSSVDHSRVKINIDEDDEICSDYINASYIKGFSKKNQYIATQGPLPHTVRDFWKMIFQENVSMIVMVSRFIENRKEKCYKYFPNNHETMFIGDDLEVRCCTELYFEIYYDLKQLTVTHMQFMEWPDFDVPDGTSNLLLFCHQMRSRWANEGGLAVVHCSAGVGRTGTIIATDILTQGLATEKSLDVFNTVLELRKSRKSMVQSEKQYMYIYQLIKSLLEDPITEDDDDSNHLYANITVPSNHSIAIAESPL